MGIIFKRGEKKEKISSAKGRHLSFHSAKIGIYVGVARLSRGFFIISRGKTARSVKLADSLRAFIILSKHYLNTFKGHSRSILSVMNYTLYIGVCSCLCYSKSKTYRGTLY